jgi:hypothetical protein
MDSTGSSSSAATSDAPPPTADLVVGLVSYNDAETIGGVTAALCTGLRDCSAGWTSRIVLADAGSTDDSVARARAAAGGCGLVEIAGGSPPADLLAVPYHGVPGRARVLRSILAAARDSKARVCVAIDARVRTIEPSWLQSLVDPIAREACAFVSPYYLRHPYDGALTKGIVYPVSRALYGVRLRQPAAGEFACSPAVIERLLGDDIWDGDGARVGIDLWLTTSVMAGGFPAGEAILGLRPHRPRDEDPLDLPTTLAQVVGSLFADIENRVEVWQRVRGSKPIVQFGMAQPEPAARAPVVDPERLIESYRLGYRELRDLWTWILPPRTIVDLGRLIALPRGRFVLDDELWARIVYDFAIAYRLRVVARDHLLRSLVPLYLGWLASFVQQTRELTVGAVEQRVDQLCLVFEAQKPYLIARWRWPERFRT